MANSRVIRKGFVDSDRVNGLSWFAECLFHRLLLVADDFGFYDARVPYLKSQLFGMKPDPVRDADIQRALASVEGAGLIRIYSVDGKPYLQILNYGQRLQNKKPKYPTPENCGDSPQVTVIHGESPQVTVIHGLDGVGDGDGDGDGESPAPPVDAATADEEAVQPPRGGGARPAGAVEVLAVLLADMTIPLNDAAKAEVAAAFFDSMESVGWVDARGRNIWAWEPAARAYARKWAANEARPATGGARRTAPQQYGVRVDSSRKGGFDD